MFAVLEPQQIPVLAVYVPAQVKQPRATEDEGGEVEAGVGEQRDLPAGGRRCRDPQPALAFVPLQLGAVFVAVAVRRSTPRVSCSR